MANLNLVNIGNLVNDGTGTSWNDLGLGNFPYTLYGAPYWDNGPPGYFNFNGGEVLQNFEATRNRYGI